MMNSNSGFFSAHKIQEVRPKASKMELKNVEEYWERPSKVELTSQIARKRRDL